MGLNSHIEWTEATWNPVTGCSKISAGCKNCYAEIMARRLKAMGQPNYRNGFELTIQEHVLNLPLEWKKPKKIFVNSMSDLFHKNVPDEYLLRCFGVMNTANWHQYQVLTKRADRLKSISGKINWSKNIWMGVSVENEAVKFRIDDLRETGAKIKFLSIEPLIGRIKKLKLKGIDWVIVGGESGPKSRPMEHEWVSEIKDQCFEQGVAFFFKQWGGVNKKKAGRILDGKTWDDFPESFSESNQKESRSIASMPTR